jgi:hypothetical protein
LKQVKTAMANVVTLTEISAANQPGGTVSQATDTLSGETIVY